MHPPIPDHLPNEKASRAEWNPFEGLPLKAFRQLGFIPLSKRLGLCWKLTRGLICYQFKKVALSEQDVQIFYIVDLISD